MNPINDPVFSSKRYKVKFEVYTSQEHQLGVELQIYQIEGGKLCIEFLKYEGNILEFNENFLIAKDFFSPIASKIDS